MYDYTVIKNMDMLGRVVLPLEMCQELDIDQSTALELWVEEDKIIFRPPGSGWTLTKEKRQMPSYVKVIPEEK